MCELSPRVVTDHRLAVRLPRGWFGSVAYGGNVAFFERRIGILVLASFPLPDSAGRCKPSVHVPDGQLVVTIRDEGTRRFGWPRVSRLEVFRGAPGSVSRGSEIVRNVVYRGLSLSVSVEVAGGEPSDAQIRMVNCLLRTAKRADPYLR